MSTYGFPTLYTTLPHNLIKEKLNELNEQLSQDYQVWYLIVSIPDLCTITYFNRDDCLYLACSERYALFNSEPPPPP